MKNLLFATLALLACTLTKAQSGLRPSLGIKFGAQASKLGQPVINWDSKYRWHAGLLAHFAIAEHFAVQPELLYSAQGAEHITTTTETELELNYLNVPILVQYVTNWGFRFQAGPQIGFLLDAKRKVNGGAESDIKNSLKKADLGAVLGISYKMKAGLGFDARYVYGLTDIAKANNTVGFGADLKNLAIQVGVFYQFKR